MQIELGKLFQKLINNKFETEQYRKVVGSLAVRGYSNVMFGKSGSYLFDLSTKK